MGLPLDWRNDPIVQIENVMFPVLTRTSRVVLLAQDDPKASEVRFAWKADADRLLTMLRTGADAWLEPTGFPLDPNARAVCATAADTLQVLVRRLSAGAIGNDQSSVLELFQTECVPAIMAALDAIRSVFIGGVLARQARHATDTERALHELGTISKTILFISINASIEAARAGDAGRSFTVIANDIRTLARNAQNTIGAISAGQ